MRYSSSPHARCFVKCSIVILGVKPSWLKILRFKKGRKNLIRLWISSKAILIRIHYHALILIKLKIIFQVVQVNHPYDISATDSLERLMHRVLIEK